jgi:integrase
MSNIASLIGRLRLADRPRPRPAFRNELIATGRSHALARKIMVSLGTLLGYAQSIGKVARNVVREQPRRRSDGRHKRLLQVGVDIPTKDELRAMLSAASDWFRPVFVLAVFTGLRASELRGLTWADVDLDRGAVTVRQRADRWGSIGCRNGCRQRTIPLALMAATALRVAAPSTPATVLFPARNGQPQPSTRCTIARPAPLQRAAGIKALDASPNTGTHALWHAAPLSSSSRISRRSGSGADGAFDDPAFDTYGHLFPARKTIRRRCGSYRPGSLAEWQQKCGSG